MTLSGAPLQRVWLAPQTTIGAIPNSAGVWTNTGAVYVPHTRVTLSRLQELIAADYKTGVAATQTGTVGRASGTFSLTAPVMPSGAAGTKPGLDLALKNLFGAVAVSGGVSVTYTFLTGVPVPFIIGVWNESGGTTNTSQFAYGCVVESATITLGGGGYIAITFNGKCFYVLESDNFANEDTTGLGGLTAFPAEPNSPALTGNQLHAYDDSVTFGGSAVAEFVSAQISINTGRTLRMDGGKYPTAIVQGRRSVALSSLKFMDSDGAALATVKNAASSKSALDVIATQGATAGSILTHTVKKVQFGNATFSESGAAVDVDFSESIAHPSTLTGENDYTLALT